MNTYLVRTLGCKANLYDSQLIEAELQRRGWKPFAQMGKKEPGPATEKMLCIVNSCTVTDEADRQTRRMASRLFRDHPGSTVVVTGCGAEVDPERMAKSPGIRYVIGNRDKPGLVDQILSRLAEAPDSSPVPAESGQVLGSAEGYAELLSRHPLDREWPSTELSFFTPPVGLEGQSRKTRAFLKIQEGCNAFCTYCIIPYGRGPSRSLGPDEVIAQIRELVSQGVREVVITGTNIGDYGTDLGGGSQEDSLSGLGRPGSAAEPPLTGLFQRILGETALERLRVSSLDPTEITPGLTDLMRQETRFCPHFHVSLQSPSSKVLKLMKRKYAFAEVKACLERIQEVSAGVPGAGGVFVGMDVIAGFPGETLEDFDEGFSALSALPWSRLHVFPYSERAGTPATRLPASVPVGERQRRTRELNALSLRRLKSIYQETLQLPTGSVLGNVLLERPQRFQDKLWLGGYTPNYLRVLLPMDCGRRPNELVTVVPLDAQADAAAGDAVFIARLA